MSGAWNTEPDELKWMTSAGYAAEIHRHPSLKHLCGYVGVPATHPLFGIDYNESVPGKLMAALERRKQQPLGEHPAFTLLVACAFGGGVEPRLAAVITVHGGVTFSGKLRGADEALWWFGFDCAHMDDYSPGLDTRSFRVDGTYRDIEYVKGETESLADQLLAIVADVEVPK